MSGPKTREQKRAEAEARNRAYRVTREARDRLKALETQVATMQTRHDELVAQMGDESFYANQDAFEAAMGEYAALKPALAAAEREWLEVAEQVERIEAAEGAS